MCPDNCEAEEKPDTSGKPVLSYASICGWQRKCTEGVHVSEMPKDYQRHAESYYGGEAWW